MPTLGARLRERLQQEQLQALSPASQHVKSCENRKPATVDVTDGLSCSPPPAEAPAAAVPAGDELGEALARSELAALIKMEGLPIDRTIGQPRPRARPHDGGRLQVDLRGNTLTGKRARGGNGNNAKLPLAAAPPLDF